MSKLSQTSSCSGIIMIPKQGLRILSWPTTNDVALSLHNCRGSCSESNALHNFLAPQTALVLLSAPKFSAARRATSRCRFILAALSQITVRAEPSSQSQFLSLWCRSDFPTATKVFHPFTKVTCSCSYYCCSYIIAHVSKSCALRNPMSLRLKGRGWLVCSIVACPGRNVMVQHSLHSFFVGSCFLSHCCSSIESFHSNPYLGGSVTILVRPISLGDCLRPGANSR